MQVEIERKFLLANDSWRAEATGTDSFRDGLIAASDLSKVRVRISDEDYSQDRTRRVAAVGV